MVARTLQLGFSFLSLCVAAMVLAIVLDASIVQGDETTLDLSRGRDVAFVFSIAFLAGSLYILVRSVRSPKAVEAAGGDLEEGLADGVVSDGPLSDEPAADNEESTRFLPEDELGLYQMIADAGFREVTVVSEERYPVELGASDPTLDAIARESGLSTGQLQAAAAGITSIKVAAAKPVPEA